MKNKIKKMTGATLLEVLLVLSLAGAMLVAGLRLNQSFQRDADITTLRFNIDQLFQAAAGFYQANCRPRIDPETGIVPGTGILATPDTDPNNPTIIAVPVADLKSNGFLNSDVKLTSPLVRAANEADYFVQLTQIPPVTRETTLEDGSTVYGGKIIMWRMMVAVELRNTATAKQFENLMGADCLSTLNDAETSVIPCSMNPVLEDDDPVYVVWERMPSYATEGQLPNLWMTNANVKQFTNLYTTSHTVYTTTDENRPAQNYMCGG